MTTIQAVIDAIRKTAPSAKFQLFGGLDDVIGVLANYIQVATFVLPAAWTLISLIKAAWEEQKTEPDPAIQAIYDKLNQIIRAQGGLEIHNEMLNITNVLGPAQRRYQTLMEFGVNNPQVVPADTLQDTGTAVTILSQKPYWYRPFFPALTYLQSENAYPWIAADAALYGSNVDPDIDNSIAGYKQVFDHQLTLPAYCLALYIYHTCVCLLAPTDYASQAFVKDRNDELGVLIAYYNKAVAGLHLVRTPMPFELRVDLNPEDWLIQDWNLLQRPFGAVDIYSGFGIVAEYPDSVDAIVVPEYPSPSEFPYQRGEFEAKYAILELRLGFGKLTRWKSLYIANGFDQVWSIIQKFRKMLSPEDVELIDRNSSWSLKEINNAILIIPYGEDLVASNIAVALAHVSFSSAARPLSFRRLLDLASP